MIRAERTDAVEVIRLDRPEARNAMDTALLDALLGALETTAADPEVRALVLSTTDVTAFSAGADVREELDADGGVARMERFTRLYAAVDALELPTVAVCVGNCVGAGAEVAAGCDVRVGGDNLKLAWVGARHGVPVGPARLVPLVGLARAKELILTGRVIGAPEAREIGFLHATSPAAEAEAAALRIARTIAERPPEAVCTMKRMFRELERTRERTGYENERLMAFQRDGTGLPREFAG